MQGILNSFLLRYVSIITPKGISINYWVFLDPLVRMAQLPHECICIVAELYSPANGLLYCPGEIKVGARFETHLD